MERGNPQRHRTHHFEGPERQEGVAALVVGPGVPARELALLQDELFAREAVSLVAHPAAEQSSGTGSVGSRQSKQWRASCSAWWSGGGERRCTHGPDSTMTDPTFFRPDSVTSLHSAENSPLQPWKFSNSNSSTCSSSSTQHRGKAEL